MNISVRGRPYEKCSICGAHLDFGEKCDCEKGQQDKGIRIDEKFGEDRIREGRAGRNQDDCESAREEYF